MFGDTDTINSCGRVHSTGTLEVDNLRGEKNTATSHMALVSPHTSTEENTFRRSIEKTNLQKNVFFFFFGTMGILIVDEGVFRIDV